MTKQGKIINLSLLMVFIAFLFTCNESIDNPAPSANSESSSQNANPGSPQQGDESAETTDEFQGTNSATDNTAGSETSLEGGDNGESNSNLLGVVKMLVTDMPMGSYIRYKASSNLGGIEQVLITVSKITIHQSGDCTTLESEEDEGEDSEEGEDDEDADDETGTETDSEAETLTGGGGNKNEDKDKDKTNNGQGQGNDENDDLEQEAEDEAGTETEAEENESEEAEESVGEWKTLSETEQSFDLIQLANGVTDQIALASLAACHYTQIRLYIKAALIVVNGQESPMEVPSDALKLTHGFTLQEGMVTPLIVDFDAQESIHQTGNGDYKLRPTVKIIEGEPYPVETNSETENNDTGAE